MSHVLIERSHSLARHSKVHSGHELGHSWIRAIFMGGQCLSLSFSTPAECTEATFLSTGGAYLISARALFFCSLNSVVGVLRVYQRANRRDPFNCCDRCEQAIPLSFPQSRGPTGCADDGSMETSDALNPTKRYARTFSSSSSSSPCNCKVGEQTRAEFLERDGLFSLAVRRCKAV